MSCTVDKSHLAPLIENPDFSKVALIGKIELKNGKKVLVTEKYWTAHRASYEILDDIQCSKIFLTGKRYLYLSPNPSDKISVTSGLFQEVSTAGFFIKKLDKLNVSNKSVNPTWSYCENDSECGVVKNQCQNDLVINNAYKKSFLDSLDAEKNADCSKETFRTVIAPKCIENFCETK